MSRITGAVLILLTLPAMISEAVDSLSTHSEDLIGRVRYLGVSRSVYSWRNGQWRVTNRSRISSDSYDEDGYLVSTSLFHGNGVRSRLVEYSYYESGELKSRTTTNYTNRGAMNNRQVSEFRKDGSVLLETTVDAKDELTARFRLVDRKDGYSIERTTYRNGSVASLEETVYDEAGRVIEERRRPYVSSVLSVRRYHYRDDGSIESITHTQNGDHKGSWDFVWTSAGDPAAVVHMDSSGDVLTRRSYSYDEQGKLSEERAEHIGLGGLEHTHTYKYDSRGNVIYREYHQDYTDFVRSTDNEFDTEGRIVETILTDTLGGALAVTSHEYDSFGREVAMTREEVGIRSGFRAEYRYDETGRVIGHEQFSLDGEWVSGYHHTYNAQGNIIEEMVLNADGSMRTRTSREYEYDERGNWIKMTRRVSNNSQEDCDRIHEVIDRAISYYQ